MTICGYIDPAGQKCGFDDKGHRPYVGQNRKDKCPSITTVSELLDDGKSGAFGYAGAEIAAVTAVHDVHLWATLRTEPCSHDHKVGVGLCPACAWIRGEHKRRWDAKAEAGTHAHHMALAWWHNEEVTVDAVTGPIMDSLAQFIIDLDPQIELAEFTVIHNKPAHHLYRGQGDTLGTVLCPVKGHEGQRCRWIWDNKFGGYYPKEQTLQVSAQRFATHVTDWSTGEERILRTMPRVDHAGVLMLAAEGYRLIELPADQMAFNSFLRGIDQWRWLRGMDAWERKNPSPDAHPFVPAEVPTAVTA